MFLAFQRFPVSDRSPVADLCLSYRLRLCLSPFGYPASSWTAYPCTDLYRMPYGLRLCLFPVWIPCPIADCLPVYRPRTDQTTSSAAVFLYLDLYTCVWTADTCTKSETVKRFNCTYLCLLVVRLDPQSLLKALQYELANMDPADAVRVALQAQGKRIVQSEEVLHAVGNEVTGISTQMGQLSAQFEQLVAQLNPPPVGHPQAPAPNAAPALQPVPVPYVKQIHLSHPEKFSGESGNCRAFLVQCGLHFEMQTLSFLTERSRVAYIISYLTGRAEK